MSRNKIDRVLAAIEKVGVIACMRGGFTVDTSLRVAEALIEVGANVFEFTMNSSDPVNTLKALKKEFKDDCIVGMGTVLTLEEAEAVLDAKADFVMAPCFDPIIFNKIHSSGVLMAPGVTTPTEAVAAHQAGARLLKLFPVGPIGVEYLRAVRGPLNNFKFFCDGRIPIHKLKDFIAAGAVGCGQVESLTGDGTEDPEVIKQKAIKLLADIKEARESIKQ